MQFGCAMFFTDYSMSAMDLARALEERGFEAVWAPEHSHIPLSRKTSSLVFMNGSRVRLSPSKTIR